MLIYMVSTIAKATVCNWVISAITSY